MTDARLLKSYVERIERLEEEQAAIGGDKRDIFKEAKDKGFNTKVLRRLIRERKRDAAEREQEEAELETYRAALGMGVQLVKSGLSLREAAKQSGASKSSIHRALAVPEASHEVERAEAGPIAEAATDGQGAAPGPLDTHTPPRAGEAEQQSNGPSVAASPFGAVAAEDTLEIPPFLRRVRAA